MSEQHTGYLDAKEYRHRGMRSAWPYATVAVLVFAISIVAARDPDWALFGAGWILLGVCVTIAFLHPQLWPVAPFGALAAALLIRWGTDGPGSGVGPLLLVPVIAVALYGTRRLLVVMLLTSAAAVVGVHLLNHGARFVMTSVWRQDLIMLTLATALGLSVHALVNRLRAEQRLSETREARLQTVSVLTRAIATSADPTRTLCREAVALTGAAGAALFRLNAGEPELLASENADPSKLRSLAAGRMRESLIRAGVDDDRSSRMFAEGSPELESCRAVWPGADPATTVHLSASSESGHPGVLALAWARGSSPEDSPLPLDLLASEASIAIRNHELTEQLQRLTLTDPLTGIANRRGWERQIGEAVESAARDRRPLSLAIVDLDGFKAYNDRYGHQAGDQLLVECVAHWTNRLRSSDRLARYGGDEFTVILPATGVEDARRVVERMCRSTDRKISCSAGVAEWNGTESVGELLERADRALYSVKSGYFGPVRTDDPRGTADPRE